MKLQPYEGPALTSRVSSTMARVGYAERITPSQIQPLIDASARYGTIKASFPASDLFAPGVKSQ